MNTRLPNPSSARAAGLFAAALLLSVPSLARAEKPASLTVYSNADPAGYDPFDVLSTGQRGAWYRQVPGFGVVRETRRVTLEKGENTIDLTGIAAYLDPTTVSYEDLTDPKGTSVAAQSFLYDLISTTKLTRRYIGQNVRVRPNDSETWIEGRLLASEGSTLVLETQEGLRTIPGLSQVQFAERPKDLLLEPTLRTELRARKAGAHDLRLVYQTRGMTWRADYNLVLNEKETRGQLTGWVSLLNASGRSFEGARVQLVAGDVQKVGNRYAGSAALYKMASSVRAPEEESLFEYHLYTLNDPLDVPDSSVSQVTLVPPVQTPTRKQFVYYGADVDWRSYRSSPMTQRDVRPKGNPKVDVYVAFDNTKKAGLGIPLPRGRVRLYKADSRGLLQFLGEDTVDHTPRDRTLKVRVGQSFDVVGSRKQTDFVSYGGRHIIEEAFTIEIQNTKDEAVEVVVRETLYRWSGWKILEKSHDFTKEDSRTIHFPVKVPKRGTVKVTYRVRYAW